MRRRLLLLALPVLSACADWADDVAGPSAKTLTAPVATAQGSLADRYIVVFRDDVSNPGALADALVSQSGGTVHFKYAHAIKGFAATLPAAAIEGISRNPNVAYIEPDGVVSITATDNTVSSWGLDRIDQRDLPLSGSYTYATDGAGVRAYIIDTGIRLTHSEFGTRASFGFDAFGGNGSDCHGHGTHVAGTVGGAEYGVARNVNLVAVRVLDCGGSGSNAGVIAGVNYVASQTVKPAVANMSLGGGFSSALNTAVNNAIASGVTFAVAAGNSNGANACNYSPASAGPALTVGATTDTDARASYSNTGSCVDLFAPGSAIKSAWSTTDGATATISGTSMASPHVAGVAALYLSTAGNSTKTPSQVEAAIEGAATPNKVTNPGSGSPNLLLHSVFGGSPPPSGFTLTAVGYKVRGFQTVDVAWSGAGGNVNVFRGTNNVGAGAAQGSLTDNIGVKGGGISYIYKACLVSAPSTCSNSVTVNF